ncbi:MAG: hypothetical protein J5X22_22840 [Candidatus Accumulibacter sp.]|uniref:hypothetical protein n=1 Tax=Accumulibacter sp. TaxID=2053492 RepID=UPI001ACA335A|nr:hypothetical protein [Accumulibacter sp.]MBN8516690.1 hypothetical protein [Accumulibacter sp.]MBO3713205.1 hypothetical protein [Accumulibacter sp.]
MPTSPRLTAIQRNLRIAKLASEDPRTRCHAALDLCHAAWAGTDIAPALPALALVAARPHTTDLDAMWAQHALEAAAFAGADLTPALPVLLAKIRERVNQYAAAALRTWASRSFDAAAVVLREVRTAVPRPLGRTRELVDELEFLSSHHVSDAEVCWTTDRKRGVRARAGRLYWRSSHGWDLEQSCPDFARHGVPREHLKYWTGSWRVPLHLQNTVRAWLELPAIAETEQDRALKAVERALDDLAAARFGTEPDHCGLCAELGPSVGGSPLKGYSLPAAAARLKPVTTVDTRGGLYRCPSCGTLYERQYEHDYEPFEEETDWEGLSRVTLDEVRRLTMCEVFGSATE